MLSVDWLQDGLMSETRHVRVALVVDHSLVCIGLILLFLLFSSTPPKCPPAHLYVRPNIRPKKFLRFY